MPGYGKVDLKTLVLNGTDASEIVDKRFNKSYIMKCVYSGSKVNYFNNGSIEDFKEIIAGQDKHNTSSNQAESYAAYYHYYNSTPLPETSDQRASYLQDDTDYLSETFNTYETFSVDANSVGNETNVRPVRRRRALFNLYAFNYEDSYQRRFDQSTDDQVDNLNDQLNPNHIVPQIKLVNVRIRNFLVD